MEILICLVVVYFFAGIGSILMSVGTINGHAMQFVSLVYLVVGIGFAGIFLDQMVFVFASEGHKASSLEVARSANSNADNGVLSGVVMSAVR